MPYRLTHNEPPRIQKVIFYSYHRPCDHYKQRYCTGYRTPRQCCTCADSRPLRPDGRYPRYIDGTGWERDAPRWAGYCAGCQKAEKEYDILRSAIMIYIRPQSHDGLYPLYVDGLGWVYGATRWQFYCQSCKEVHEMETQRGREDG
ncbi:hypothetical protein FOXYSP1_18689 [Fusarium oxysporum f. sp. phaseoli]